jgi:hypothetical protein
MSDNGSFKDLGRDSLGDDGRGSLRELAGKYFEGYFIIVEDFPFDFGYVEEYFLAKEGVIGLCLGFLLDNSVSGSATRVVFFGSGLALVVFFLSED